MMQNLNVDTECQRSQADSLGPYWRLGASPSVIHAAHGGSAIVDIWSGFLFKMNLRLRCRKEHFALMKPRWLVVRRQRQKLQVLKRLESDCKITIDAHVGLHTFTTDVNVSAAQNEKTDCWSLQSSCSSAEISFWWALKGSIMSLNAGLLFTISRPASWDAWREASERWSWRRH